MSERILIADDEEIVRGSLEYALEEKGYRAKAVSGGEELLRRLEDGPCDLVIADLKMPGMDGIELVRRLKARDPGLPVIIITAHGAIDSAVEAIRQGARDYITKPFDVERLLIVIERCLENRRLAREVERLREEVRGKVRFEGIVGSSKAMRRAIEIVERVADSDATALIQGKSGTGKELIARAIHFGSRRKEGPFLTVNCGSLPESLLENELFGHARGAFTGATSESRGLFEAANGGTLFLDEVDSMSPSLQVALLRALQEKTIRRIGSSATIPIDARIVAASSEPLGRLAREGGFREDLFYRLNVVVIDLPELCERKGDIPLLAWHFLKKLSQKHEKAVHEISHEAIDKMLRHQWPGNVRELENKIEQGILLCRGDRLEADDIYIPVAVGERGFQSFKRAKNKIIDGFERDYIVETLRLTSGNVTKASELAGLDRTGFQKIMRKHDVRSDEFRK